MATIVDSGGRKPVTFRSLVHCFPYATYVDFKLKRSENSCKIILLLFYPKWILITSKDATSLKSIRLLGNE